MLSEILLSAIFCISFIRSYCCCIFSIKFSTLKWVSLDFLDLGGRIFFTVRNVSFCAFLSLDIF